MEVWGNALFRYETIRLSCFLKEIRIIHLTVDFFSCSMIQLLWESEDVAMRQKMGELCIYRFTPIFYSHRLHFLRQKYIKTIRLPYCFQQWTEIEYLILIRYPPFIIILHIEICPEWSDSWHTNTVTILSLSECFCLTCWDLTICTSFSIFGSRPVCSYDRYIPL